MGSYVNTESPAHVDQPPLLNSAYGGAPGVDSWDAYMSFDFNIQHNLEREIYASSGNHLIKIPKVESVISFSSDTAELPNLKRPKYSSDLTRQMSPILEQEANSVSSLSASQGTASQQDIPDHLSNENGPVMMSGQSTDVVGHFRLLNEPSPLGLNLRKSPSLLDLIQKRLSQKEDESRDVCGEGGKISKSINSSSSDKDKLKAANFPAVRLRVGTWECISRYDGDLVAKCYYAKRKLVWEVLDKSLKSKMEVQWSDISGLRASFPEDQSAIFDIELSRPPLFFREINPQPRKHTLWQSTSDFTDGQATICRHHSIQFPVGVFNRHFEKLLQCDMRLKALHAKNLVIVDSCFYDSCNIPLDRQNGLHYHTVLSDHLSAKSLSMSRLSNHLQQSALSSFQGHCTAQRPQHDSQLTQQPTVDQRFTLDESQTESMQHTVRKHNNFGGPSRILNSQGGFQLQFSSSSPSSVIDMRVLTECSSSSETEEAPRREIFPGSQQSLQNQTEYPQQQVQYVNSVELLNNKWTTSPTEHLNIWTTSHLHLREGPLPWEGANSPKIRASEKQALNALSLHLLGEPITPTDPVHMLPMVRSNAQEIAWGSAGPHSCEKPCCLQEAPINQIDPRYWKPTVENNRNETGLPPSVSSHGSYVDLVYLPRIASQPQFLERGLQQ